MPQKDKVKKVGTLTIWTEKSNGDPLNAQFRIYNVNNIVVGSGYGTVDNPYVIDLPAGEYTVNFLPFTGYSDPPSPTVYVTDGSSENVVGVYTGVTAYAQINVNTVPVVGTILCDGSIYGYGSVPIIKFPPVEGQDYVISFLPVDGYNTPLPQTVTLFPGDTVNVTGTYVLRTGPSGFLTVNTTLNGEAPAHTEVFLNGVSIGHDVENLELDVGTYVVSFGYLSSWITPPNVNITIVEGQVTEVTGNYTIVVGPLIINTVPIAGDIFVNGKKVGTGNVTMEAPAGTYNITFGDVMGYTTPDPQTIIKEDDLQAVYATGTYIETSVVLGKLIVHTTPVSGVIYIDGENMGSTAVDVEVYPGTHAISFGEVSGYTKPNDITVTVNEGETLNVTGTYTEIINPTEPGRLVVSTTPVFGEIFVNSQSVGIGSINIEIDAGNYTVAFGTVPGYLKPESRSVTITPGTETTVIGTYTEIVEPPPGEEGMSLWPFAIIGAGLIGMMLVKRR